MKNKILIASAKLAGIILMISICALDSETYLFHVTALVSMAYLYLFYYANKERFEREVEDE